MEPDIYTSHIILLVISEVRYTLFSEVRYTYDINFLLNFLYLYKMQDI